MSHPRIGRYFDFKIALTLLGLLLFTAVIGGYTLWVFIAGSIISIGGIVFTVLALVLTLGSLLLLFPKGCRTCKKKFETMEAVFHASMFDSIVDIVKRGNPAELSQLAAAPPADGSGRHVKIDVQYCAACRSIGLVTVNEEQWNGKSYSAEKWSPELPLIDEAMAAVVEMISARGQLMAHIQNA